MPIRSLLLVLLAFAAGAPIVPGAEPASPKRPNILFILVDDQSPFDLKRGSTGWLALEPTGVPVAQEVCGVRLTSAKPLVAEPPR